MNAIMVLRGQDQGFCDDIREREGEGVKNCQNYLRENVSL